jgi:hypothetical protein
MMCPLPERYPLRLGQRPQAPLVTLLCKIWFYKTMFLLVARDGIEPRTEPVRPAAGAGALPGSGRERRDGQGGSRVGIHPVLPRSQDVPGRAAPAAGTIAPAPGFTGHAPSCRPSRPQKAAGTASSAQTRAPDLQFAFAQALTARCPRTTLLSPRATETSPFRSERCDDGRRRRRSWQPPDAPPGPR